MMQFNRSTEYISEFNTAFQFRYVCVYLCENWFEQSSPIITMGLGHFAFSALLEGSDLPLELRLELGLGYS